MDIIKVSQIDTVGLLSEYGAIPDRAERKDGESDGITKSTPG